MTKIVVDIKIIDEVGDYTMLVLYSRKPERKSIPWYHRREESYLNNAQFEMDSKRYQEDLKECRKEIHKIHIGHALLIQDFEGKEEMTKKLLLISNFYIGAPIYTCPLCADEHIMDNFKFCPNCAGNLEGLIFETTEEYEKRMKKENG